MEHTVKVLEKRVAEVPMELNKGTLNHKLWIDAAMELIKFDEVEKAQQLLELVPAFFRDYRIVDLEELKSKIYKACITAHAYGSSELDAAVSPDQSILNIHGLLRGQCLLKEMEALKDKHPFIVDCGPGEYWAPIGLSKLGYQFDYKPVAMDTKAASAAKDYIAQHLNPDGPKEGQPVIFLAHEIIEHLPSPKDLVIEAMRHCGKWPDYVHLSTPLYTFDATHTDWDKPCGLPHLRAYTPREFILEAATLFPGYNWEYKTDAIQSLRLYKDGGTILGDK